jgi:hypothetical protein
VSCPHLMMVIPGHRSPRVSARPGRLRPSDPPTRARRESRLTCASGFPPGREEIITGSW